MATLDHDAVLSLGFASVGKNVRISDRASFHGTERIHIGSNVRIDDFCVLSAGEGGIDIGSYIHIAVFTSLIGAAKITLMDFCNLSSRVSVYSSNDDYSGATLMGPMVPAQYKNVNHAPVYLGKHVIVGCGSVILPGVRIPEGAAIGALSLVTKDCEAFTMYAGVPAKIIKKRKLDLLDLERQFLSGADIK